MVLPNTGKCHHCDEEDHWKDNCPWLLPPEDKADHDRRFAQIMRRWNETEMSPLVKQRMIKKENELWQKKLRPKKKART